MVSYFLGGPLADRYSARRLMTVALVITAAGGILFFTIPRLPVLTVLYGLWGLTTILLFWAALIRATREWGGISTQGVAYGILDGGRGLFVALLASLSVWIFAMLLPVDIATASLEQKTLALQQIIMIFTVIVVLVAVLIWVVIPDQRVSDAPNADRLTLKGVKSLVGKRTIWLQAVIVVCAYVGYKITDDFSLYASDAFGYDDVAAARLGTVSFWVRPFAALLAGVMADRSSASTIVLISFGLMLTGGLVLAAGIVQANMYWTLVLIIVTTSIGIYGLRGIYFALIDEAKIPLPVTGSAVGLISVLGFTPDIFMGPLMGYLIDRSPGALGHQHVFYVLSIFAITGLIAAIFFRSSK
jgi:nitrate/nitrite transporter NarK